MLLPPLEGFLQEEFLERIKGILVAMMTNHSPLPIAAHMTKRVTLRTVVTVVVTVVVVVTDVAVVVVTVVVVVTDVAVVVVTVVVVVTDVAVVVVVVVTVVVTVVVVVPVVVTVAVASANFWLVLEVQHIVASVFFFVFGSLSFQGTDCIE